MASTIRSVAGRAHGRLAERSLFVKVNPIPATLSQRRAVLKALQRHGEIEVFKKLANEASFIAAAATTDIARKLIDHSPLSFHFVPEPFDGLSSTTTLFNSKSSGIVSTVNPIESTSASSSENHLHKESTRFTVHIFRSQGYKHMTMIRYSPLHGPWPKDQGTKETFVYSALKKSVPQQLFAREALCDWHTGGQLSDDARNMRNQAQTSKLAHIHERIRRRKQAKGPDNMLLQLKSLRQPKLNPTPTASQEEEE